MSTETVRTARIDKVQADIESSIEAVPTIDGEIGRLLAETALLMEGAIVPLRRLLGLHIAGHANNDNLEYISRADIQVALYHLRGFHDIFSDAAGLDTMALTQRAGVTLTLRKHYTAREHVEQAIEEEQREERLAYLKGRLDELAEAGR
jgi:hypothetical protein